jgi:hypothetical protein
MKCKLVPWSKKYTDAMGDRRVRGGPNNPLLKDLCDRVILEGRAILKPVSLEDVSNIRASVYSAVKRSQKKGFALQVSTNYLPELQSLVISKREN